MCSLKLIAEYLRRIFLNIGYTKGVGVMAVTAVIDLPTSCIPWINFAELFFFILVQVTTFFFFSKGRTHLGCLVGCPE